MRAESIREELPMLGQVQSSVVQIQCFAAVLSSFSMLPTVVMTMQANPFLSSGVYSHENWCYLKCRPNRSTNERKSPFCERFPSTTGLSIFPIICWIVILVVTLHLYGSLLHLFLKKIPFPHQLHLSMFPIIFVLVILKVRVHQMRSEERRVGKECW